VSTRRQPNKKKIKFVFFPYLLFVVILFYFFSFMSTLRTMLCLSVGGRILVFFVVSLCFIRLEKPINIWKKNYLCFPILNIKFYLLNSHWFMRIWVWYMRISWDRWKYKSNEWMYMQVFKFNYFRNWLWKYIMLT
jgi:hypothetical protein